jgi:hypothetical protein
MCRTSSGTTYLHSRRPTKTATDRFPGSVRPIQEFLEKWGVHFDVAKRQQLLQSIVEEVCDVYSTLASELLRSALELEESLKSRKLQRSSGSSSTLANNAVSDTEKMRMQLLLDLEEIQRFVSSIAVHCEL